MVVTTEPKTKHRCRKDKPTARALRVAMFRLPLYGYSKDHPDAHNEAHQARMAQVLLADLKTMAEKSLCEACGYPLDNSPPHPDSPCRGLKWT